MQQNFIRSPSAHSGSQAGYPSSEDFDKSETLFERSEFVSLRNRRLDGSPRVAGLDLFGTFWGNAKKYEIKVDLVFCGIR